MKKKILVLTPIMPQASDLDGIAKSLAFLQPHYHFELLDSLAKMEKLSSEAYYALWADELNQILPDYDALFGFSFGGMIIQQCLPKLSVLQKPIIFFSTPSFSDDILASRLGQVLNLCQAGKLSEALQCLYQYVFYPTQRQVTFSIHQPEEALLRLIFGLQLVLETDSRPILSKTAQPYLHLIGECSQLVNEANIVCSQRGKLLSVANAGMRILEDNPAYCQKEIEQYFQEVFC